MVIKLRTWAEATGFRRGSVWKSRMIQDYHRLTDGEGPTSHRSIPLVAALVLALPAPQAESAAPETDRVSVATDGQEANRSSGFPSLSADGRFIAFASRASNLVAGDENGQPDVFVHDSLNGATTLVSVSADGGSGNGPSRYPAISADGRRVAFASWASNLVSNDTNGSEDVFVFDLGTGSMTRVSVRSDGTEVRRTNHFPKISADGTTVGFQSTARTLVPDDTNGHTDSFVHSLVTGLTIRVSVASDGTEGNGDSFTPRLSADGRVVAFASYARNLVPSDDNRQGDVFLHNLDTGQTTLLSIAEDGGFGNGESMYASLSWDGRFVSFTSLASDLVAGDTNTASDVFVRDLQSGKTARVSLGAAGIEANGASVSSSTSLSADGRFVSFTSLARNLVNGDTNDVRDAFVRDLQTGGVLRMNVASDGAQANGRTRLYSVVSADARYVAFASAASNLAPLDLNRATDIFVRGPLF